MPSYTTPKVLQKSYAECVRSIHEVWPDSRTVLHLDKPSKYALMAEGRMGCDEIVNFSNAVPTENALEIICKRAPNGIVEIGAGTGFWAACLERLGADVVAYEPLHRPSPNCFQNKTQHGNHLAAEKHPDRALFLCWPLARKGMAIGALNAYKGDTVIYIGHAGMTGDDAFIEETSVNWDLDGFCQLPLWPCYNWSFDNGRKPHDVMRVFRRR